MIGEMVGKGFERRNDREMRAVGRLWAIAEQAAEGGVGSVPASWPPALPQLDAAGMMACHATLASAAECPLVSSDPEASPIGHGSAPARAARMTAACRQMREAKTSHVSQENIDEAMREARKGIFGCCVRWAGGSRQRHWPHCNDGLNWGHDRQGQQQIDANHQISHLCVVTLQCPSPSHPVQTANTLCHHLCQPLLAGQGIQTPSCLAA